MLETMYKELFNSAPVPLIITDQKGTIRLANAQANALLSNKAISLVGLSFCSFIDQSFLKNYLPGKPCLSFEDLFETYKVQPDHQIKSNEGISIYADIKAAAFRSENEAYYIWTFDTMETTKKLTHDLNERVKEQLSILNVIELCFQNHDIHTTLQLCLQPIREGWQFPEATEVRITLATGEQFSTDKFTKTQWSLQSEIMTANEHYGYMEVCYLYQVPADGGKIFLYEEERLIKVLGKILGTIIEHRYNSKRLNEAVVDAQEEERYQLGMELHDNVQQILAAAFLNVEFLEDISTDATHKDVVRNLKKSLTDATNELRRLSQQLAPSIDPACPLTEKINFLTKSMSVHGRLRIKINVDPGIELNEKIELGFYRIIQEQLTNIIKHAMTSEVEINIRADGQNIILSIVDKGIGFDPGSKKNGIGFENIRRRTEFMNGSLDIASSPGKGTGVTVSVPMA
ncbi:MAG TPA: ATP-binding protein [Chitinophagaceae bacterium]|nr:ATP-binding protein [Chitinophagaceae bacterium]